MAVRCRVIMYFFCVKCACTRPHNHVQSWPSAQRRIVRKGEDGHCLILPSKNPIPNVPDSARRVQGVCMICGTKARCVTSTEVWNDSHYKQADLCSCGLPPGHEEAHLERRRVRAA